MATRPAAIDAGLLPLLRCGMIELEHGDPWLVMAEGPTVEPSTQDHVLTAAIAHEMLKGIFRISTPDNDEGTDWPDFGKQRAPEEPAEWSYTQDRIQWRAEQPDCGSILKDSRVIVHEVVCPMGSCKLSGFTRFHFVPPD